MKKLEELISSLEDSPTDYLKGTSSTVNYKPENILFFSRTKTSQLNFASPFIHYRFNLIFNIKGSLNIHFDNTNIVLKENELLLLQPYQTHHYEFKNEEDICCMYIGFDLWNREHLHKLKSKPMPICNVIKGLIEVMFSVSINSQVSIISTIINICVDRVKKIDPPEMHKEDTIISKVQKYIYSDLRMNVNVSTIAEDLGLSESTLHKHFKKNIGISPGKYFRKVKINYSCSILKLENKTIKEVAYLCGFNSLYSFSRSFKQVTGITPTEFKKTYSNK